MKSYIVTFDKGGILDTFDYAKFHEQLTNAKGLLSWWHYLPTSYILLVPDSSNSALITQFILPLAPNKHFFVAKVDLKDHNGWLPQEAWDWINKHTNLRDYK